MVFVYRIIPHLATIFTNNGLGQIANLLGNVTIPPWPQSLHKSGCIHFRYTLDHFHLISP